MPKALKSGPAPPQFPLPAFSMLSDWIRQGTESFFATQRILLDLVMRQNANTIKVVRERLAAARALPAETLAELAGEGVSNFVAAQRVLLHLSERQNEIVMGALEERTGAVPAVGAMTELLRSGVDTFIDMQQHFLTIASKQADAWVDAATSGEKFQGKSLPELAREAMDVFVRSQKKFLDLVAEETAVATGAKPGKGAGGKKKTELAELAKQGAEAFIDAQKKLLDVAAQQMAANAKAARRTAEVLNPLPAVDLATITRQTVEGFVTAQKALLDVMGRAGGERPKPAAESKLKPTPRKRPAAVRRKAAAVSA